MKYLDITFPTPEENLACDEALLQLCEEEGGDEILRFWEATDYFVVLGYSGKVKDETNFAACTKEKILILRRPSGGGTILQGPGCLSFALVLKMSRSPLLTNISRTNAYVLTRHQKALRPFVGPQIEIQGLSDLACTSLKFSGNAQRRKRTHLLFHGTFLLNFDMLRMEKFLPAPPKQPAYRKNRTHKDFLKNLKVSPAVIKEALRSIWKANNQFEAVPMKEIKKLSRERYSDPGWNFKF